MALSAHKQQGSRLPDLPDWFEPLPSLFGWRPFGQQAIRIEDYLEGDTYVLRAELPGIDPERDLTLTVSNGVLELRAERSEQDTDRQHAEFRYGSFQRAVTLPVGAREDSISASYEKGILTVRVRIDKEASAVRTIEVAEHP